MRLPASPAPPVPTSIGVIAACILAGLVVLLDAVLVGARYYVATDGGRERVSALVQDLKLSRFGRLHVYGLKGDVLKDFSVDRITVTDGEGVWLDARNLRMKWSYASLVGRRLHAKDIHADVIQVIRRPVLEASKDEPPGGPHLLDLGGGLQGHGATLPRGRRAPADG